MNSQAIYDLTVENLRRLRFLSEAKGTSFNSERISQGKASSRAPEPVKSTEDECLAILDEANRKVSTIIEREQKRVAPLELTANARNFWLIEEGEGILVADLAAKYNVTVDTIRQMRARHGRNLENGRPKRVQGRPTKLGDAA